MSAQQPPLISPPPRLRRRFRRPGFARTSGRRRSRFVAGRRRADSDRPHAPKRVGPRAVSAVSRPLAHSAQARNSPLSVSFAIPLPFGAASPRRGPQTPPLDWPAGLPELCRHGREPGHKSQGPRERLVTPVTRSALETHSWLAPGARTKLTAPPFRLLDWKAQRQGARRTFHLRRNFGPPFAYRANCGACWADRSRPRLTFGQLLKATGRVGSERRHVLGSIRRGAVSAPTPPAYVL